MNELDYMKKQIHGKANKNDKWHKAGLYNGIKQEYINKKNIIRIFLKMWIFWACRSHKNQKQLSSSQFKPINVLLDLQPSNASERYCWIIQNWSW